MNQRIPSLNKPMPVKTKKNWRPLPLTLFFFWLIACLIGVNYLFSPEDLPQAVAQVSPATPVNPGGKQTIRKVNATPLDEPLALLAEARQTYRQVRDYSCTMIKQERIDGTLQKENVISMKLRTNPFSVYMKWLAPNKQKGQEVAYVHGRNNGMLRVRSPGLLRALGFVSISPRDPRAMKHSRHTITEAGIGNLIARCQNHWEKERTLNRTSAKVAEYVFNKRPCYRIEVAHTQYAKEAYCYRTVLYLDKQTKLPVRCECYDWPRQGGNPSGDLREVFSYINMQFNVGLSDRDFDK